VKKIPSLFVRDFGHDPRLVLPQLTPGCEWVLNGEGVATRKRDGTCCMVDDSGRLWRRYDAKGGKTPPDGFVPAQAEPDKNTGHWPGWVLVGDGPQDKWYYSAVWPTLPGTYELCGPKFQTNAEGLAQHRFFRHGEEVLWTGLMFGCRSHGNSDEAFVALRSDFQVLTMEGVVWHHPDGRLCKLKRSDFGYQWPVRA